jgi:hypothetical protein
MRRLPFVHEPADQQLLERHASASCARDLMSKELIVVNQDTLVREATAPMLKGKQKLIAVVDDEKHLIGNVDRADLLRGLLPYKPQCNYRVSRPICASRLRQGLWVDSRVGLVSRGGRRRGTQGGAAEWLQSVELRRRVNAGLNKGEARNALARAVFFGRLGEIRDRSFEQQRYRASGLNLVTAAIVLWNTVYLDRATRALARDHSHLVDPNLLQYLSPPGWEHINLTGDYLWRSSSTLGAGRFRPLRRVGPMASRTLFPFSEGTPCCLEVICKIGRWRSSKRDVIRRWLRRPLGRNARAAPLRLARRDPGLLKASDAVPLCRLDSFLIPRPLR